MTFNLAPAETGHNVALVVEVGFGDLRCEPRAGCSVLPWKSRDPCGAWMMVLSRPTDGKVPVAALILVKPGLDWQSSAGLCEFALEYLIPRLSDRGTAQWLRTVVDNNLGSVWFTEFPGETQAQVFELLRSGLVDAGERELPDGPAKSFALARLQALVDLTYRDSQG